MSTEAGNDEVVEHIVHHLSEADELDDVILEVCQRYGYDWPRAEKLVRQVQTDQSQVIARRKLPIFYISAFVMFATGLVLMGAGLYSFLIPILKDEGLYPPDLYYYLINGLDKGNFPINALKQAVDPYIRFIIGLIFSPFSMFFTGLLMVLGSLFGMRDAWARVLGRNQS